MKKITIAITLVLLGVMVSTTYASAASVFQFSSVSVDTNLGKTFILKVTLDPQGVKNYTSKMEIDFPANILKLNSFTFGGSWVPLSVSGYDLIDNTNGTLIKTAGYPGGVLNPVIFGTISFTAKKEGSGTIKITGNSLVLGATGQNILSSAPVQTPVVIKTAAVTPATPTTPAEEVIPEQTTPQPEETTPIVQVTPENNLPANVGIAGLLPTGSRWANVLWVLLVLVIIACVVYVIYRLKGKKK